MIALNAYQERVLDSLREFFRHCSKDGCPEAAFQAVQFRDSSVLVPYIPVQTTGLPPGMPYVCLGRCHIASESTSPARNLTLPLNTGKADFL